MKTLIAVAVAATLATPALAEKTPVKPVDTCASEVNYAMIMYHLERLEAMLDKLEAGAKPKPVVLQKKEG